MTTAARLSATASTTPFAPPSVTVACQRAVHFAATALLAAAAALAGTDALADGAKRYALDPTYVKECGDCHVAYPPALMQPEQWRQVMSRCSTPAASSPARNWKRASTRGARKWSRMPWKSISTICARNSPPA